MRSPSAFRPLLPAKIVQQFRPLHAPPAPAPAPADACDAGRPPREQLRVPELPSDVRASLDASLRDVAAELQRAYALACESLERSARDALAALARDVLARELALATADVDALVIRALASFAAAQPLALRVADGVTLAAGRIDVRTDPALAPGDLVIETPDGEIDLRLAGRFEELMREVCAR